MNLASVRKSGYEYTALQDVRSRFERRVSHGILSRAINRYRKRADQPSRHTAAIIGPLCWIYPLYNSLLSSRVFRSSPQSAVNHPEFKAKCFIIFIIVTEFLIRHLRFLEPHSVCCQSSENIMEARRVLEQLVGFFFTTDEGYSKKAEG